MRTRTEGRAGATLAGLVALSLLLPGGAAAAPEHTGDVVADFAADAPGVVVLQDGGGDVGVPESFPDGTVSGHDIADVRLFYDRDADTLHVGINTFGIAGDVDGDGDPGSTSAELAALGGVDHPNFAAGESFGVLFDLDEDGTFDVIAGVPVGADIFGFVVARFDGNPLAPALAFGDPLAVHRAGPPASPTAAAPHLEFVILRFSELPRSSGADDSESFSLNAFMDSFDATGIGDEYVPSRGASTPVCFDSDADGVTTCDDDCDDGDAERTPGAEEICDGKDNNCDGVVDEGFDGDGDGMAACAGDCDDTRRSVYAGADELCDGLDNDCDEAVDEELDCDDDGLSTEQEAVAGTDPNDADSDDDGLSDGVEVGPVPETPRDTDRDDTIDALDSDDDGDGLPTRVEVTDSVVHGEDPDGDEVPSWLDVESDGDGLLDEVEGRGDVDGDGVPNYLDPDSDGDGRPDIDEGLRDDDGDGLPGYLDPDDEDGGAADPDGDGLDNTEEAALGTDPYDADSDGDGISDGEEAVDGEDGSTTDPLDADSDDDGLSDGDEVAGAGPLDGFGPTDPNDADSDGDGLPDGLEVGVTDPVEGGSSERVGVPVEGTDLDVFRPDEDPGTTTDPNDPDSDDGSVADGVEDANRDGQIDPDETDPNDPDDDVPAPGDGDGDGVPDADDNCPEHINVDQQDTDGDGLGDVCDPCPEVGVGGPDNDGDGLQDPCDPDDDNDGVLDGRDNCALIANRDQADLDGNGIGDMCEGAPLYAAGGGCATAAAPATGALPLVALLLFGLWVLRRRRRGVPLAALLVAAGLAAGTLSASPAHADDVDTQAFHPAPLPGDGLSVESGEVWAGPADPGWSLGLFLHYQNDPLVIRRGGDDPAVVRHVVSDQITADLMGAYRLLDELAIGAALPVVLFQGGDGFAYAEEPSVMGIGDLRLMSRLRLLRALDNRLALALSPTLTLPTGRLADPYLGRPSATFTPRLTASFDLGRFGFAANLGYLLTKNASVAGLDMKDELQCTLGGWYRAVPELLDMLVEGRFATTAADPFGRANRSPAELLGGARVALPQGLQLNAGLGVGLSEGYATPDFRLFAGLRWTGLPPGDRDGDGLSDAVDRCPDHAEDVDQFEDSDGCPDPDNDQDGLLDPWVTSPQIVAQYAPTATGSDGCPNDPEDRDAFEDSDGCPDPDNDGDHVLDPWVKEKGLTERYGDLGRGSDQCPLKAEDDDGFQQADGCPDPDNDHDGICDPWVATTKQADAYTAVCQGSDRCPDRPESFNGVDDEDGCPDTRAMMTETKILIFEPVLFHFNKVTIKPESFPVLEAVVEILQKHPQLLRVRIEGYTDTRGTEEYNLTLSKGRAEAVHRFLVDRGVAAERLSWEGYGESRPLVEPEESEKDYQTNRRVEFTILKKEPIPTQVTPAGPAATP